VDTYRKLRNVIRWMLGTLSALKELPDIQQGLSDKQLNDDIAVLEDYFSGESKKGFTQAFAGEVAYSDVVPELERYMMSLLYKLDGEVKAGYKTYDFKRVLRALLDFANLDLSAFYFDIRKDALYCDAPSSRRRIAALLVIKAIFERFITWAAPLLPFTAEEAWREYQKQQGNIGADVSVHCAAFRPAPTKLWKGEYSSGKTIADKFADIRKLRSVVTGALELARAEKKIGSSLEAAVEVYVSDAGIFNAVREDRANLSRENGGEWVSHSTQLDMADICIVSDFTLAEGRAPEGAFTLADVPDVAVVWQKAAGRKCARSWRWTKDVGAVAGYPDVSARDAEALIEKKKLGLI